MLNPAVEVIIVSRGNYNYIERCLNSLQIHSYNDVKLVINNSGNENLLRKVYLVFPSINIISNPDNTSFCQSLNKALEITENDFVLCLNDDVFLGNGFINKTLNIFSLDSKIGMVSGKILRFDRDTLDSAGLFLSCWRTARERGYGRKDVGQYETPGYIFGVNGAVAFYRREMLEDIKRGQDYFDSDFRFFYEDLDIAWRAQNRGWKAYYVPTAIAYHARGGTARKKHGIGKNFGRFYINDELQLDLIKNRYMTIIKNESLMGLLLHLSLIIVYDLAVFGFLLIFRPKVVPRLFSTFQYMKLAFRKRVAAKRV